MVLLVQGLNRDSRINGMVDTRLLLHCIGAGHSKFNTVKSFSPNFLLRQLYSERVWIVWKHQ